MTGPFINPPVNGMAIEAKGVKKTYAPQGSRPAKTALQSIDLSIPQGSLFGLLGPNGAGKSTFINIMAGSVRKTSGQLSIWGTDIDLSPRQARANIGIVPQELNIDAFFSPRELLEFTAGMFAIPKRERRTDEILELVGLTEQANAYSRTLSGGMRRRLLVAKAMVHAPPVLVLDEPTAGVDVSLRQQLWDNVRALHAAGTTIVLTTHYLEEAQELCDHVAILNHGQIITTRPTEELLASAGRKDLHISLPDASSAPLPEAISALVISRQDDKLTLRFDPAEMDAGQILGQMQQAGLRIGDVTTAQPDLEDIFIELVEQNQQDGKTG